MTLNAPRLFACTLLSVVVASCGDNAGLQTLELQGAAMGTGYTVTLIAPAPDVSLAALRDRIEARLEHVEKLASTYRADSDLSVFNANASTGWIPVPEELCTIIDSALAIGRVSEGAFDVTVGPVVNLWGFGPDQGSDMPPSALEIDEAMQHVGQSELSTDCTQPAIRKASARMYVDLSGWAKGYAVDQLAAVLDAAAMDNYLIEIGGEIRASGHSADSRPFVIGIEDPLTGRVNINTTVRISDLGMATSGDYRNFLEYGGKRYSHTIDPRTGRPIDHELASVTVVSESTAYADAMATALLVLGPDAGMALANEYDLAAYFISRSASGFVYRPSRAFSLLLQSRKDRS